MILQINEQHPQPYKIKKVVEILNNDGIIIYPTDTIYGIGCSIYSQKAIERIRQIKGREKNKYFSILCYDLKDLSKYAKNVSNEAYKLMRRILPGPYTVVLQASRELPRILHSKRKTVGLRIPDHTLSREIVKELGHPIITTSANRSGQEPINDPELLEREFGKEVDAIIEGNILVSEPSTVIELIEQPFKILRKGKDPAGIIELFEENE